MGRRPARGRRLLFVGQARITMSGTTMGHIRLYEYATREKAGRPARSIPAGRENVCVRSNGLRLCHLSGNARPVIRVRGRPCSLAAAY